MNQILNLNKMNKQALAVFSTDLHLKTQNIDQIIDLVTQQCELAKSTGAKYLICLGDVFDSRIAQREDILTAFGKILDIIKSYDLKMWLIPGNHDKTDYVSSNSFLSPFSTHPCLTLVHLSGSIPFLDSKIRLGFIPFFKEEVWLQQFEEYCDYLGLEDLDPEIKIILCTHIAVTGSQNNDGKPASSILSTKLFKPFFKVFSGHYHDQQKIGSNFYHLPSIQQNNFGENTDKGFTILYSDGSHELVKSKFREYHKVEIDLDNITGSELNVLRQQYSEVKDNIRFEFKGSEKVLKSLRKEDFTSLGIDVKTKVKEIESDIEYADSTEVIEHTKESIREEFEKFCKQESLNWEEGLKFLNKIL